jgi:BolA protein
VWPACHSRLTEFIPSQLYLPNPGAYDDPNGSHISIQVVSDKFEGKRAVQRQQLVYKAIWEELQGPVHAVDSMVCKTPEEA